MAAAVEISVLIASRRRGEVVRRCLESLAAQRNAPPFEVLVASSEPPPEIPGLLSGWVRVEDDNPALRRNRAADFAAGRLLAFLDDDARASPEWLARAAEIARGGREIFGGIDLGIPDAPYAERISDMLLSTPFLGSGVAAHRPGSRPGAIRHAADLSACNLFIEREVFDRLGGFDEAVGFGGEDTDLVRRSLAAGHGPELDPALVVYHRRPRFPFPYLSRRWSFRWKMGRLLAAGKSGAPGAAVAAALLTAALALAGSLLWGLPFFAAALSLWLLLVWGASFSIWRRDLPLFPAVPAAFLLHHATYALATAAGLLAGPPRSAKLPAAANSGRVAGGA